jgi:hypothetical protein
MNLTRLLEPLYARRASIVMREFAGKSLPGDAEARRAIEAVLDLVGRVEMLTSSFWWRAEAFLLVTRLAVWLSPYGKRPAEDQGDES